MIVRCGNCRTQFNVGQPGKFTCPTCGTVNMVREGAQTPEGPAVSPTTKPPIPNEPSPRISCPDCEFSFIVGPVSKAICPNCGTEVETGQKQA